MSRVEELKARPYDLSEPQEIIRLVRECYGYLLTCRLEHHGTDRTGRDYAIEGLRLYMTYLAQSESDLASAKLAMQHAVDALAEVEKERTAEVTALKAANEEMRVRLEKAEAALTQIKRRAAYDARNLQDAVIMMAAIDNIAGHALSVYSKET